MLDKFVQPANELSPIIVTESGMVTDVKLEQLWNASFGMNLQFEFIIAVVIFLFVGLSNA